MPPQRKRIRRICPQCGAAFDAIPYRVALGKGIYCSHLCVGKANTIHGERGTGDNRSVEYTTWTSMKGRCLNQHSQQYPNYGGRGITVCDTWRDSFEAFLADVGRRPDANHSLDRIDNERGYEPGNVRWATPEAQSRNRRTNRPLTFNGRTRCMSEWAEIYGLTVHNLYSRLKAGWSVEQALTTSLPPK